jgi:hypothetical protein
MRQTHVVGEALFFDLGYEDQPVELPDAEPAQSSINYVTIW